MHGTTQERPSRNDSAALINFRPECDGRITGYDGLEAFRSKFHDCILDGHFPPPGTPTQPVSAGYMANAWMRLHHPDYDHLREIVELAGRTIQVRAQ